jgi:signal transduction histidine kinase
MRQGILHSLRRMEEGSRHEAASALFRAPATTPQDVEALDAFTRALTASFADTVLPWSAVAVLALWPFDRALVTHGDRILERTFGAWRLSEAIMLGAGYLAFRKSRTVRERSIEVVSVLFVVNTAIAGALTAGLGGEGHPFLFGQYLLPMFSLICVAPMRQRLATMALGAASTLGSSLLANPGLPRMPAYGQFCLVFLASCVLATALGHLFFLLVRQNFFQQRAISRQMVDLAALDRMKSEFFANVSHELRTPLTLILGSLRAAERGASSAEARESVWTGLRNAARLLNMVNEILELARLEGGARPTNVRRVDVAALLRRVVGDFDSTEQGASSFTLVGVDAPVLVAASAQRLKKVFYNLVSNAVKFTDPARRHIRVTLRAEGDGFTVAVSDNGIGISRRDAERIFERFVQLDRTSALRHEGTGIGLALVKEIVTQAGGRVEVESAVGEGSTFTVTLPRGDVAGAVEGDDGAVDDTDDDIGWRRPETGDEPLAGAAPAVAGGGLPCVLVVEDNRDLRRYIGSLLAERYRVSQARDGKEGLALARALRPDIVVTDVMMPEMNGADLLRAVRADRDLRETPVVFLTARVGAEARSEALEGGADDYVCKPFEERELLARVDNLLAKRRAQRELAALNAELEARVAARTEELRALATHLSDVLEGERTRIARDIHDELGQTLSTMRLEVDRAARHRAVTSELREALGGISGLLEETLATSRRILTQLRPRVLDDFGLLAAVEWLVNEFRTHHRLACDLSVDRDFDTDPGRATALFRILQECMNNVAKHANAASVEVMLTRDGGVLRLSVHDDGRGLPEGPLRAGAMGLLGMRERAWQYDGKVTVTGAPGRGTTVDVEIPTGTAASEARAQELAR